MGCGGVYFIGVLKVRLKLAFFCVDFLGIVESIGLGRLERFDFRL